MTLLYKILQRAGLVAPISFFGASFMMFAPAGRAASSYQVQRSVRLRSAASASLSKPTSVTGNRRTFTWSGFVKRGQLGSSMALFSNGSAAADWLGFNSDYFRISFDGGTVVLQTNAQYRDPSSHYHICVAVDTTQATASDRVKLWINGSLVTSFSAAAYPALNDQTDYNLAGTGVLIGQVASSAYFDGYLSEVNFIDGQALTPTSFAEQDSATRMWVPKKYTGTYGTNGFYLDFSDITSTTTIGYDKSGNGNHWTANGISLTSGVTYDSMLDVPGLPWADGGNGRGNYAVLNRISTQTTIVSMADANLSVNIGSATNRGAVGSIFVQSGKWYFEYRGPGSVSVDQVGVVADDGVFVGGGVSKGVLYWADGKKGFDGVNSSYGASYTTSDIIGVALDNDSGSVTFFKNGISQGAISIPVRNYTAAICDASGLGSGPHYINFGQRPFAYTPPTGFKALNTANMPDPTGAAAKPWEHFDVVLATGANIKTTAEAVFPSNYLEWIKDRANANNHQLIDIVRGSSAVLQSNTTAAETTYSAPSGSSVSWVWKAGGSPVSNTNGTITSQVSANTAAGVSVVTYTGTGANATVGHGLGVVPKMFITKNRDSGTPGWAVYHASVGNTGALALNATTAVDTNSVYFNNTTPTSTVFSVGTGTAVNTNTQKYVAYCFAEIAGFSRFGSYTGNGSSDGPFVFCGFRPRYVLIKRSDSTGSDWAIHDTARDTYNVSPSELYPNLSNAEGTSGTGNFDMTANGFKVRSTVYNASGGTYIYAAFAEAPFKYANAR